MLLHLPMCLVQTSVMSKTNCESENVSKVQRKSISLDVKLQVLRRLEAGERQVDIGASLNLATSTIRTIIKNADKIISSATTTSNLAATKVTRSRNHILEKMEKSLCIWIYDQTQRNVPLSQLIIMDKARTLFADIKEQTGDTSIIFTASRGWFERFKKRSNLNSLRITDEAVNTDINTDTEFLTSLKTIIERGCKRVPSTTLNDCEETQQVADKCLNGVWKKILTEVYKNPDQKDSVIRNIVNFANESGLENINEKDIEELLQVHGESVREENVQEQAADSVLEVVYSDDEEQTELTSNFLSKSISTITRIMDQFVENDPDYERSSKARQDIMESISCYQELLCERKRKKETTVDGNITKIPKMSRDPQSCSSSTL